MKFISYDNQIENDYDVIFVSDMFVEDYVGGAELTLAAIYKSSPKKVKKIYARELTDEFIRTNIRKLFVFGNFSSINPQLLQLLAASCRYVVCEFDYKYCIHRSPDKHKFIEGKECICNQMPIGALISSFYSSAERVFFMSHAQMRIYTNHFPFLRKNSVVLSSVFDDQTLDTIAKLRNAQKKKNNKYIVLGSESWVKGFHAAEEHCKQNNIPYEIVWNIPYEDMLVKLSESKGLCYLPAGQDTCPRLVIEAKLLNCDLITNENVQHRDEAWFKQGDPCEIERYLRGATFEFWDFIESVMLKKLTVSGYCTTYNCIQQEYPFEQCIRSMLAFCDEVCVVDGGSTDGTLEVLDKLRNEFNDVDSCVERVHVRVIERDWSSKQSALFDGMQKAEARDMCSGDYCWQMDVDEIVHEDDAAKVRGLVELMREKCILGISLPVVEWWGPVRNGKIRVDVPPTKPRLSRNSLIVTHGAPQELRRTDDEGNLYCATGTDGCDMVSKHDWSRIPFADIVTQDVHGARIAALQGNKQALLAYQEWFNSVVQQLPSVFHYSWTNIARKIQLYKNFWGRHWEVLYHQKYQDTAESNMFFDVPWSQVNDEMVYARAQELENGTGGHVFHSKWNGACTPHIALHKNQPKIMEK